MNKYYYLSFRDAIKSWWLYTKTNCLRGPIFVNNINTSVVLTDAEVRPVNQNNYVKIENQSWRNVHALGHLDPDICIRSCE